MKTNDNRTPMKVTTKFETITRFAPAVNATVPARGAMENELDELKRRLLARELARTTSLHQQVSLQRAANDAAALAWQTPYPLLLLPALFEEKALAARLTAGRQALIRERSNELLTLAE